jgi:proteasome accessory factor B
MSSVRKKAKTKTGQPASGRQGTSRPAMLRVAEIHRLIRQGRRPNCSTLAREIEVTAKTIQRDISFMRDQLNLPLEYDAVRHGYYYSEEVSDFPSMRLSRHELVALFLARQALEPMRGTKLQKILSESFRRIAGSCSGELSISWEDLDEAFSVKAAGAVAADVTLFSSLMEAVQKRRVISFHYRKPNQREALARLVHPHHVGQVDHGWYMVGWDQARKAMRTFALQRIEDLKVLAKRFERETGFDARQYFGAGFGVWSYADGGEIHHVKLRFHDYAARFVAERQWHSSQKLTMLKDDGTELLFEAWLGGLEELTRWVLSWGSKVEVLGPSPLRQRVQAELHAMLKRCG